MEGGRGGKYPSKRSAQRPSKTIPHTRTSLTRREVDRIRLVTVPPFRPRELPSFLSDQPIPCACIHAPSLRKRDKRKKE